MKSVFRKVRLWSTQIQVLLQLALKDFNSLTTYINHFFVTYLQIATLPCRIPRVTELR